jgi:hypothetical protein
MLPSVFSLRSFLCTQTVRRRARERIQRITKKKTQLFSRILTRRARKAL